MISIIPRLFLSTIADDAAEMARSYGLGLEIAEFCTAYNMDTDFPFWDAKVRGELRGLSRFTFHAPFNELCPASVDPLIIGITQQRYAQAYDLMETYGIHTMIAHTGFVPPLHDEGWFAEKSAAFWRAFLRDKPEDFLLCLENVLESTPDMLCAIARAIGDKRCKLCLDLGHAALRSPAISAETWASRMLPYLGHVHMHNNFGKRDSHSALGGGSIPIASVIRLIGEAAPEVTFTIETSETQPSLQWLSANGFI